MKPTGGRYDRDKEKPLRRDTDRTIGTDDSWGMNGTVLKPAADGRGRHGERRSNLFLTVQDPLLFVFGHIVTQRGLLNRAAYEVEQLLARHVNNALIEELFDDIFVIELNHGRKITKGQNSV